MFTVEFESDESIVKTLDQKGKHEDVEVIFGDEGMVYIRQYDPEEDYHQLIIMSGQQWIDIMAAYKSSAGSYYVELKHE